VWGRVILSEYRENGDLYLLRVGADTSSYGGNFWSPVFKDRRYLFIPIPEFEDIPDNVMTYASYKWEGMSVSEYLPPYIRGTDSEKQIIHDDPEFRTFTYGSPRYIRDKNGNTRTEKNYNRLRNLKKGDGLVFYAAFSGFPLNINSEMDGYYCFAYFVVQTVVCYDFTSSVTERDKELIEGNHHFRQENRKDQIIVVGNKTESRVFEKAVLLSSRNEDRDRSYYYPSKRIKQELGNYGKSLTRSSIRMFPGFAPSFKSYLDLFGF